MKTDIPIPCFFGGCDFYESIGEIAALGFDAAETYNWTNLDLAKTKSVCDHYGVKLVSICTTDFSLTADGNEKHWLSCLSDTVAAAKKLGCDFIITQSGDDTGENRAVQHERIVKTLSSAAPLLEDSGITLIIEPLNTLINHKGCYLSSSAEAFDIVREADCPNVRVLYDIYHQQITEGNIINNITENLPLIAHMHAAGNPGRHELWLGENDYGYIFDALKRAGYTGRCAPEYNPTLDAKSSLREFSARYGKYFGR